MKCLILAAGYATRLYPLTENFPKPLLTVGDKTILDWLIDDIDTLGEVDEYVVISNHKFAHIFQEWAAGKGVEIIDDGTTANENRIGAVEDLRLAIDDSYEEDALHLEIWIGSDNAPKSAEIYWKGRRLLTVSVSNFVLS